MCDTVLVISNKKCEAYFSALSKPSFQLTYFENRSVKCTALNYHLSTIQPFAQK